MQHGIAATNRCVYLVGICTSTASRQRLREVRVSLRE